ncbi:response regulator [Hymenobacter norwichensis]|uniref:response regulator n=1 Tax=Hymenobacter norwichensis TaxID=223903 RepID=UPI0003B576E3|nr:response regulator transcription factor [Hymenobacter norwichensis]
MILDDHLMLNQGLERLLNEQPDLQVLGQFVTGPELLAWLAKAGPTPADVLLLDLHLPPPDGLTLLPRLRQQWPSLRVLVFSTDATPELISRLVAAGASGFVSKAADAAQLLLAIRAIFAGETCFPVYSALPAAATKQLHRLSTREKEIVGLVRLGFTTSQIADRLSISVHTATTHRRNIMHKLELHNVAALVRFAHEEGL